MSSRSSAFAVLCATCFIMLPSLAVAQESGEPPTTMDPPLTESSGGLDQPNVLQWNVCDYHPDCANDGELDNVALLRGATLGSTKLPRAIGVQEICSHTYDWLESQLDGSNGYYGLYQETDSSPDHGCDSAGLAIFIRQRCGSDNCTQWLPYQHQVSSDANNRGALCSSSLTLGYFACSTHLTPNGAGYYHTRLQMEELASLATFVSANDDFFVMGDMNIPVTVGSNPGEDLADAHLNWWYNRYREADECAPLNSRQNCARTFEGDTQRPPNNAQHKLDYIFITKGAGHCERPYQGKRYWNNNASDHFRLRGYFDCS